MSVSTPASPPIRRRSRYLTWTRRPTLNCLAPWNSPSRAPAAAWGSSFEGRLERLNAFDVTGDLRALRCPPLAMVGAGEGAEAAQVEAFAEGASKPVTRRVFTVDEAADMHCQLGNLPLSCAVLADLLDETQR